MPKLNELKLHKSQDPLSSLHPILSASVKISSFSDPLPTNISYPYRPFTQDSQTLYHIENTPSRFGSRD